MKILVQMYHICFISATIRNESFRQFMASGRNKSIKKDIVRYLSDNPNKSFTAAQLKQDLSISYRSSLCKPLFDLVDGGMVTITGSITDKHSKKPVGLYSLSKSLFDE